MLNKTYNILIVEDEWINANFMTQILETLQQKVIGVASNAEEALESLQRHDVDFVFMDINIDGPQDGIALARKINQTKVTPIIYMSAFGDSHTLSDASFTNIYGFIIKPFTQKDVETVFSVALQCLIREQKNRYVEKSTEPSVVLLGAGYTFNLDESALYHNANHIMLSKNESKLLKILSLKHDAVVSTERIRASVWKDKNVGDSNIRDTVLRLRKKIQPLQIENVSGIGYKLEKE